jgi:hypothetical protein
VTVPTVERGLWLVAFCSIEIAGAQTFDQVDVRLFHQLQELPRVGRQRFDVAPLAFGVQRVEGERGLAGTGQPGDHDQLVARQIEVDVLQVVGAGAADADEFH